MQPASTPATSAGVAISALHISLISYWKLDEVSGTRADSVIATGNTLTDNNTVTSNPGKISLAGQFTGANSESLSIADNASLSMLSTDFTLAAWVYLDTTGARTIIAKWDSLGLNAEYLLEYSVVVGSRLSFTIQKANNSGSVTVTASAFGALSTATWYLLIAWYDSVAQTINLQINDGTIFGIANTAGVRDGTSPFALGAIFGVTPSAFWNGRIDETGVWKRVLTVAERTALYNAGAGYTWPFV